MGHRRRSKHSRRRRGPSGASRVAGATLIAIGLLHASWAAGSSWPAKTREGLAEAVAGTRELPPVVPTVVVAVGAVGAGVVVAGGFGDGRVTTWARRLIGVALLGRGLTGGGFATRALGMPTPGATFRRLDASVYRPLCVLLGSAILGRGR